MLKQTIRLALAAALLSATTGGRAHALPQGPEDVRRAEKVKERAAKFHEKRTRRVEAKLKDGRKFKGRVVEVTQEEFVLADAKAGNCTIRYDEVKELKHNRPGNPVIMLIAFGAVFTLLTVVVRSGLKGG